MAKESIDIIADRVDKIICRKCGRHLDVSGLEPFSKVQCPECKTSQPVPALLGSFLLLELLGSGGMGNVYQALDQALGRYVAIKVMKQPLSDDPQFVENFLREARTAAALNHRNVVQIYSCGQEKNQPYIVMELVNGGRLDEMIATGNPLEEVRALEIGIDVAEGLKAANDIGMIHGDVKPANILFDKEGTARVADFGLARFLKGQYESSEVWGTPYYIAPEKARGQKTDHRSDIYSLGATLYHALGAKPPFDGKTATDVVLARLKNPAIGLRVVLPSLQPETADVIARMLEADPFMRYPTYASVLADLREALRVAKQEQRALRRKVKKTPILPVVVIIVMIAITVAILATSLWRSKKKAREEAAAAEAAELAAAEAAVTNQTQMSPEEIARLKETERTEMVKPLIQPFPPAGEQVIAAGVAKLVAGNPMAMEAVLQPIYEKNPVSGTGRYWIRMFQFVSAKADGRDQDAQRYLKEIRDVKFTSIDDKTPHPAAMFNILSKFMLGEADEGMLNFEMAKWPQWYGDLAQFFVAFDFLGKGQLAKANEYFGVYAGKTAGQIQWPYSLQPLAQKWMELIVALSGQQKTAASLIAARQAAKAREGLVQYRMNKLPIFMRLIDKDIARATEAEARELEQQRKAERKAHQEKVQRDLDKLEEVRTANLPMVGQKDFRKASAALSKAIPELKTNEGQQYLLILRDMYDRMDALKKYLIGKINAAPFRQGGGTELGGDATSANFSGIGVALGQHGVMVKPWEQVSVRLFIQLTSYYLADTTIPEKERAEQWLGLALLCYESGGFKPAAAYADQAAKLDPALKTRIGQLMPDLVSN